MKNSNIIVLDFLSKKVKKVVEKLKEFLENPKNTAILGLLGGILMLICFTIILIAINFNVDMSIILSKIDIVGIIIYFTIVLLNIYKKNVNIKVANYLLIMSFLISLIINIIFVHGTVINKVFYIITNVIIIAYLYKTLFKEQCFNNKIFAIAIIVYIVLNCLSILHNSSFTIYTIIQIMICISYLAIVPYFYNKYYDLKDYHKNKNTVDIGEIAPLGVRIISLLFPIVGAIIYAVNIKNSPRYANSCGTWALCGFGMGLVAICLWFTMIF